ncbi:hypothetical protein HR060_11660 [Catenovulum sp. SM1970]|uniref:hypothetical protein n=1 Tax=Marinifaba aquimaris TaxID=2741323 RepID=UPI0015727EA2|nr:hypothetical protein [Marinifaba aquimaris]NTS77519.1 hypothetical protein [Marinifaba aquimaris]
MMKSLGLVKKLCFLSCSMVLFSSNASAFEEFDAAFYLNKYPDLQAAFGNDHIAAKAHWENYGKFEMRQAVKEFDAAFYMNTYPDLAAAFGANYGLLAQHWRNFGIAEGRQSSADFDIYFYLNNYIDLVAAFGTDYNAALNHWYVSGELEGRHTVAYSVTPTDVDSRVAIVNSLNYQPLNISTQDLANTGQTTFDSLSGTNDTATITSGVQEGPYVDWGANITAGETTIINLNVSTNTQGYDIDSLYLAFGAKNAGDLRSYDVYFSRVRDDSFVLAASVNDVGNLTGTWTSANWGDDTITSLVAGQPIGQNVDAIKIVWKQAGSYANYKVWEVDVYGQASN